MRIVNLAFVLSLFVATLEANTATLTLVPPQGGAIRWSYYAYAGGRFAWSAPQSCGTTANGLARSCFVTLGKGTAIQLTAVPLNGAPFQGWTGTCAGNGIPGVVVPTGTGCSITLNDNYTVGATMPCPTGGALLDNIRCVSLTPWPPGVQLAPGTRIAIRTRFWKTPPHFYTPVAKWVGLNGSGSALDASDDTLQSRDLFTVTTYDSTPYNSPWYILQAWNGTYVAWSNGFAANADMATALMFSRNPEFPAEWRLLAHPWQERDIYRQVAGRTHEWKGQCIEPNVGSGGHVSHWSMGSCSKAAEYDFFVVQ